MSHFKGLKFAIMSLLLGSCGNVEVAEDLQARGHVEVDADIPQGGVGGFAESTGGSGVGGAIGTGGMTGVGGAIGTGGMTGVGGAIGADAGPMLPPVCSSRVFVEVCSTNPTRRAVCHREDGGIEVGCSSDPVYMFLCVRSCA